MAVLAVDLLVENLLIGDHRTAAGHGADMHVTFVLFGIHCIFDIGHDFLRYGSISGLGLKAHIPEGNA